MSDEPIWVSGGVAGLAVRQEDLDHATGVLALASDELADAVSALAAATQVWPRLAETDPAREVVACAVAASEQAGECHSLARELRAAVEAYAEAERQALAGLSVASRVGEIASDLAGTAWWELRWAAAVGAAVSTPAGLLALAWDNGPRQLAPDGLPPQTSWLNGEAATAATAALRDHYEPTVRALVVALTLGEAIEPDYAGVVPEPGARPVVLREPGVEGLMDRLDWTERLGGGAVAIETLTAADGTRSHVVYIPGTQDWGVTNPNPADAQANVVAVLGGVPDAGRAVRDALEAHGVTADEPVMLAGHSQGGMIAAVAAGALGDRYRVTHVVTAGSPTARIVTPTGVGVLHLENTRDVVPGLDGARNPDTRDRITVTHDRRRTLATDVPDRSLTVAEAHGLDGYAATARLVDQGAGASAQAWTRSAGGFLRGGGSEVTVYRPVPQG